MKKSANWLNWSLQFLAGLLVGGFIGYAIVSKRRRFGGGWWLAPECVSMFLWGAALLGAGLASFYGERLWWGSLYRVIPPDEMEHSRSSRVASIATGALGCILIAVSILRHFGVI